MKNFIVFSFLLICVGCVQTDVKLLVPNQAQSTAVNMSVPPSGLSYTTKAITELQTNNGSFSTGSPPTSASINSGSLPPGLTFNTTDGTLSGQPAADRIVWQTYSFNVTASNAGGSNPGETVTISLNSLPAGLNISDPIFSYIGKFNSATSSLLQIKSTLIQLQDQNFDANIFGAFPVVCTGIGTPNLVSAVVGDFNGDGNLDVAAIDANNGKLVICADTGTGFEVKQQLSLSISYDGHLSSKLVVLDQNGALDIALVYGGPSMPGDGKRVDVLTNAGGFSFSKEKTRYLFNKAGTTRLDNTGEILIYSFPISTTDPTQQILIGHNGGIYNYLNWNTSGDGNINAHTEIIDAVNGSPIPSSCFQEFMDHGDLNNDGKYDFALSCFQAEIDIYEGDGFGGFTKRQYSPAFASGNFILGNTRAAQIYDYKADGVDELVFMGQSTTSNHTKIFFADVSTLFTYSNLTSSDFILPNKVTDPTYVKIHEVDNFVLNGIPHSRALFSGLNGFYLQYLNP